MNTRISLLLLVLASCACTVNAQVEPAQKPEGGNPAQSYKTDADIAKCDSQLGKVCILSIERLIREEHGREHPPIGVVQGRVVVWISSNEDKFKFDKFLLVDCRSEEKRTDRNDRGPFQTPFGTRDKFERVKYSTVTGKVGNCYKHVIEIQGKGKFDPHIIIESP
jgi:hypothetical protein